MPLTTSTPIDQRASRFLGDVTLLQINMEPTKGGTFKGVEFERTSPPGQKEGTPTGSLGPWPLDSMGLLASSILLSHRQRNGEAEVKALGGAEASSDTFKQGCSALIWG